MPEAPVPQGAPAAAPAAGGGITEAIVQTDKQLSAIAQTVASSGQLPDEVKGAFAAALEAYRQGVTALSELAAGGGAPAEASIPADQGAVTPEQGGSGGAVPMSHGRMR